MFWQAKGFPGFLAERILLGVVTAGLSGADVSFLYQLTPPGEFQKNLGIYQNLSTAGLLAASGIYTLAVGKDYRLAALLTVGSYGLAFLLALGMREAGGEPGGETNGEKTERSGKFRFLPEDFFSGWSWKWAVFLVVAALAQEFHQMLTTYLGQLQYARCGAGSRETGLAYLLVTLSGLAGGYSAAISRKLGEQKSLAVLLFLPAAGAVLLAGTRSLPLSVGAVVLVRICFSLFWPLQMHIQNRQVSSGARATALSRNAMLMNLAACGVNPFLGWLADKGLPFCLLAGGGFCLAGAALLPFLLPEERKQVQKE